MLVKVGYEVCYDYKGYQLNAGNRIVFPSKEIAEKYKKNYQQHDWVNEKLYVCETKSTGGELTPCRKHNGKDVYNKDWYFGTDALDVGDYVEEEIVDYLMNCLPPRCSRSDCCQIGEPFNHKTDENGVAQPTFGTFKKVAENTWEFCGYCFAGENEMRGNNSSYVR